MYKYKYMDDAQEIMDMFKGSMGINNWNKCYGYRIRKFFEEFLSSPEHYDRKLMEITEKEVNDFLASLPYKHNEKVNFYNHLKAFFNYSLRADKTRLSFEKVNKFELIRKPKEYVNADDLRIIQEFIQNDTEKISYRLLLALFLYTGLSRNIIANMCFSQFNDNCTEFYISLKNGEYVLPIKKELSELLQKFRRTSDISNTDKFFTSTGEYLSGTIGRVTKKICKKRYTPTILCNTFIKQTLSEDIDKNIYAVSKLTLESLKTIEEHVSQSPDWLIDRQREMLKRW